MMTLNAINQLFVKEKLKEGTTFIPVKNGKYNPKIDGNYYREEISITYWGLYRTYYDINGRISGGFPLSGSDLRCKKLYILKP